MKIELKKIKEHIVFLSAISDKSRLKILNLLLDKKEKEGIEELTVTEIMKDFPDISNMSKITYQLKILLKSNYITVREKHPKRYYSLNKETLSLLSKTIKFFENEF